MEFKNLKFEPEEGFLNSDFYEDAPAEPREILQRQHNQTRDYINGIVNVLNSQKEGESGSESIKSPAIGGVLGNNVYLQIKDIKRQLNDIALDKVPDGSVTEEKLADASVGFNKLKDGCIGNEKFAPDACAPYAQEVKNINGVDAEEYEPVSKSGTHDLLKCLVSETPVNNTKGKNYKDKRYIADDGYINCLDLKAGTYERVENISISSNMKFAILEDGSIVVAEYKSVGDLYLYALNTEYKELTLIKNINLSLWNPENYAITDMDFDGEYMYVGMYYHSGSSAECYLFKIKFDEIDSIDVITGKYIGSIEGYGNFFCAGKDVVWGNYIYRNGEKGEIINTTGMPLGYSDGYILMKDNPFILINAQTLMPVVASYNYIQDYYSFISGKHLYRKYQNYIFKTKIL